MNTEGIYVSKGRKAWWKLIFPTICFSFALYIIIRFFNDQHTGSTSFWVFILVSLLTTLPLIVLGIVFSMVKDFHFNIKNKKYKIVKRVGFIGFGSWKEFDKLNYLSIHKNINDLHELKLWYNENKHHSIAIFKTKKAAIEAGKDLVKNLFIDFYEPDTSFIYSEEEINVIEITDDKRTIDVHISEGTRPFWQTIIAAMLYTAALVSLYFFYQTIIIDIKSKKVEFYFDILEITSTLFFAGIGFSVVKDYLFDLKNNQYKIIFRVGPFKIGKWYTFRSLDYISVFKKNESQYLVNLWYNKNKHFIFSVHKNLDPAIIQGKVLSKSFGIKLLDATDPQNSTWLGN